MADNPPQDMPRITPYLYYNDVENALSWLQKVFQFEKRMEMPGPDGWKAYACRDGLCGRGDHDGAE